MFSAGGRAARGERGPGTDDGSRALRRRPPVDRDGPLQRRREGREVPVTNVRSPSTRSLEERARRGSQRSDQDKRPNPGGSSGDPGYPKMEIGLMTSSELTHSHPSRHGGRHGPVPARGQPGSDACHGPPTATPPTEAARCGPTRASVVSGSSAVRGVSGRWRHGRFATGRSTPPGRTPRRSPGGVRRAGPDRRPRLHRWSDRRTRLVRTSPGAGTCGSCPSR